MTQETPCQWSFQSELRQFPKVTTEFVGSPEPLAQNPKFVEVAPGAMDCAHDAGMTVTVFPLLVVVPLQDCVMTSAAGSVNEIFQVATATDDVFFTCRLRQ